MTQNIKIFCSSLCVFILVLISAPTLVAAENVKIGALIPLTGPAAIFGTKIQQAITSFANDRISFVFEDEGCDPKMAVTAYKKLSNIDGVRLFLGPLCGSPQSAVAPLFKKGEQLAVLGNSAPEAVFSNSGGRIFSTQHSIETESTFLAGKLNEENISSVVIIFKENAFSRAHEAAFRASFKGKIVATFAYTSDDTISELKSIVLKVKQLKPDALYVPDFHPLANGLMKELKAIGAQRRIYSVYSVQSDAVLKVLGADGEGLIYSYPDIGDQDAMSYFPALAAKILIAATTSCGTNVSCVHDALVKQNSFDAHGVLSGKLRLKTIRDGKFVVLG